MDMQKVLLILCFLIARRGISQDLTTSLQTTLKAYLHTKQIKPTLGYVLKLSNSTVAALHGFANKKTGTFDSDRGEITNGALCIHYDIGFSAGAHINNINKEKFDWSVDDDFENYRTMVGIKKEKDSSQIVITIYGGGDRSAHGNAHNAFLYPANFWAYIKTEAEIKNVLDIAWSYTPTEK